MTIGRYCVVPHIFHPATNGTGKQREDEGKGGTRPGQPGRGAPHIASSPIEDDANTKSSASEIVRSSNPVMLEMLLRSI